MTRGYFSTLDFYKHHKELRAQQNKDYRKRNPISYKRTNKHTEEKQKEISKEIYNFPIEKEIRYLKLKQKIFSQ